MVDYFPNPEDDASQQEKNKLFEAIHASDEDVEWVQDPQSYFTVMPYPKSKKIMVRVYNTKHQPLYLIDGDHPRQIYYKMIKMGLITKMDHAAYLGKELQKAYIALQQGLHFNQDDELDFNKKIKEK